MSKPLFRADELEWLLDADDADDLRSPYLASLAAALGGDEAAAARAAELLRETSGRAAAWAEECLAEHGLRAPAKPVVLLVERLAVTRALLRSLLVSRLGCVVVEARDGAAAKGAIERQSRLDLVITDMHLAEDDRLDLIAFLRRDGRHARAPLLVLCDERRRETVVRVKQAGASRWLLKSSPTDRLVATITDLLSRSRLR